MANGSISRSLVNDIRDQLNDAEKRIIPNDNLIYKKLSEYQVDFMSIFHCTTQDFEFDVTVNTDGETTQELSMDARLSRIKSWRANDSGSSEDDDIIFYPDYKRRKIIVEYSATATKLIIRAFIIPATHLEEGNDTPVSDDITRTYDPIIGTNHPDSIARRFYALLRDAVLSEYSTKQRPFKSIEVIYQKVAMLADELQGSN